MSKADELAKFEALRKEGVLSQEEFDAEEAKLLGGDEAGAPLDHLTMTAVKYDTSNSICDTFSLDPLPTAPPSGEPPPTATRKAQAAALVDKYFGDTDWSAS
ncbi:MAG: SHOCT domain-containing protein [Acidimicrobiales bacterium]|jgi:hypothetical protein